MFSLVWVILEQFLHMKRSLIHTFTRKLAADKNIPLPTFILITRNVEKM